MFKLSCLRIFVALAFLSTVLWAAPRSVPVVNASFEGGVAKGLPAGWSRYGGLRKTTDVFLVPGRDGTVLRLEDRDPAAEIGITQIVPWPGGTTVQAICQTAGMPGSPRGGAFLQIRFSPSGKYLQRTLVTTENGAYSRTVVEGEVPPGTKVCQLFLYTHAAPKPHVLVDDLKLMADVVLAKKTKRAKGVKKMAKPKPPVYAKLKPLHLTTPLAQAVIAVPKAPAHGKLAERIQTAIHAQCGRTIPIVSDTEVKTPLETHVIAVGNRSTNDLTSRLYDRYYSLLDLKYPGVGGHVVRTVHNPFGTAFNAVTLGGSDDAGVAAAVEAFLAILTKLPPGDEQASIGRIVEIQLGKGMKIPKNPSDAKIWEESRTYGSSGYFGWCVISKCMALYHMTGEERFAREFLRLAFPDEKAIADLEKLDGERIENKHEPLAGPYHYSAHMMILFWDLIEESPFFDDETRLRVTNAFSKQLEHRLREHVYGVTSPPASVGNRHGDWSAMALYTLARYFQKDYPGPVWEGGLESCRIYFSALLRSAWLAGRNDHIFWYTSYYDPMLDYMYLSGDFSGWEKGFLKQALVTQDVLFNGSRNDWGLKASSLNFLLRAADLTGDARWLFYRDRTEIDTNGLRLGQSFWPAPDVQPRPPTELLDRWTIQPMPEPFWKTRASGFTLDESFLWGSYRNSLDDSGDLILIKGANGGGRNPYHTFSLLEFRLDGVTLLKGYGTQVLTTADGLVEPKVAMDGALKSCSAIGDTAWAVGEVPEMPFCNWRRHILRRKKSFCVIVDELTFETDSENMTRQTIWDTVGGTWDAAGNTLRLAGAQNESTLPGWKTIRALDVVCRSKPSNDDGPRNMIDLNSVGIRMVKARDPGDFIEMEFVADQPMEGELFAKLMDHSDRGGVRILLDGKVVVPAYTHFSASTQTSRVPLGRHTLQPGTHRLRVEAVSRHEGLDRCYIGLAGLAMKGDQAKMELKPTSAYELHPSDAVSATGRGKITMTWNGEVKAGEKRAYFYLVARGGGEVLACRRISPTAAFLRTPQPAVAMVNAWNGIVADSAILTAGSLFVCGLRTLPAPAPLVADQPVHVDWNFITGTLVIETSAPITALALSAVVAPDATLDGKPLADARSITLAPGIHRLTGVKPNADSLAMIRGMVRSAETAPTPEVAATQKSADSAALPPLKEDWTLDLGAPMASLTRAGSGKDAFLVATGRKLIVAVTPAGRELWRCQTSGTIRTVHWWPEHELLLVGCKDEKLIALDRNGKEKWQFVSKMDHAVWEAAKQYWFKSAHPGVYGVNTGVFIDGKTQCFVGGACTLEVVDEHGELIKRLPAFWGPGTLFRLRDAADGSRDLLIVRQPTDGHALKIVNSRKLRVTGSGFDGVPAGHTYVTGWATMSRNHLFIQDINGDGKDEVVSEINGFWNRVTIWDLQGRPLHNAQFGPGRRIPARNMRSLALADLDGDGKTEILAATSSGLIVALDCECQRLWSRRLPSAARKLVAFAKTDTSPGRILAGCQSGEILLLDHTGVPLAQSRIKGTIIDLVACTVEDGRHAVCLTAKGGLSKHSFGSE